MTDDIVTRLRMSVKLMQGFPNMKAKHFNTKWFAEAADEIASAKQLIDEMYEINILYRETLTTIFDDRLIPLAVREQYERLLITALIPYIKKDLPNE